MDRCRRLAETAENGPSHSYTLGSTIAVSFTPFPANGEQLAPPPAEQPPLEGIQFSLPDGTLVTRFGVIGRSRHVRERGEDWNEIGYGPNETVDAQGNPVDKEPARL